MDSMSRPPPPEVPPIDIDGVRYSQVMDPEALKLSGRCGYLLATDIHSGKVAWVLQVYTVKFDTRDEIDVQEVYFESMQRVGQQRALRIVNEASQVFVVDLDSRQVQAQR
jgi:glucose dehydrogenase